MWVQKRKDGKFQLVERYIDEMTGKPKRVSVEFEKNTRIGRKMAEQALQEKMARKPSEARAMTLQGLVDAYRADQELTVKPSTCKRNFFAAEAFMDILGRDTLINKLTAPYIRQSFIKSGRPPGTLNELLTRLKAFIRWAYHNDLIKSAAFLDKLEPFKDVPHKVKIQDKFLEAGELDALLNHMKQPVWKQLTEFLALSGLRVGEAIALNSEDVDFKKRVICVNKNFDSVNKVLTDVKSYCSIREVYMQKELFTLCKGIRLAMLEQRFRNGYGASSLFFQSETGGYLEYYAFNKYLRENSAAVLGRNITPHVLRHTHASLLMEQGIPIDTISRRLGHENSRITREIYLHVTEKLQEKDNERLDNVYIL